jgi:hypothetical protein
MRLIYSRNFIYKIRASCRATSENKMFIHKDEIERLLNMLESTLNIIDIYKNEMDLIESTIPIKVSSQRASLCNELSRAIENIAKDEL